MVQVERSECDILDFILTRIEEQSRVTNAKSIPNADLDTDHRPVIFVSEMQTGRTPRTKRKARDRRINLRKLQKEESRQEVETSHKEAGRSRQHRHDSKNTLTDTLSKTCGTKKTGKGQVKQTAWWNGTVKEAIKEKKKLYKVWVKSKLVEDYVKYRLARRQSKRTVRMAKEQSWKTYGEELSELCKRSIGHFYKSVKAMRLRDEPYSPTTVVNDRDGNPINDKDSMKKR